MLELLFGLVTRLGQIHRRRLYSVVEPWNSSSIYLEGSKVKSFKIQSRAIHPFLASLSYFYQSDNRAPQVNGLLSDNFLEGLGSSDDKGVDILSREIQFEISSFFST
jgi:hypothetical protein